MLTIMVKKYHSYSMHCKSCNCLLGHGLDKQYHLEMNWPISGTWYIYIYIYAHVHVVTLAYILLLILSSKPAVAYPSHTQWAV